MMRKAVLAAAAPATAGFATSRYLTGFSRRPARRPVNRNEFAPALPARAKLPRSLTSRVHLCALRFDLVGLTQRPPRPRRPGRGWTTVNRTFAATFSL